MTLSISTIPVNDVWSLLSRKEPLQLIDLRPRKDFNETHIEGSINRPLETLNPGEFDKAIPVYLICLTGKLAREASERLKQAGFTDVKIVAGGLVAWKCHGFPLHGSLHLPHGNGRK